ncbi:hypothetical protein CMUS01_13943 [Colletotrichum musicola]|uniref:Uncharacterized protein n=1 Tax=Colletotrichum musicola TaxID=2175873 RepID=A0A8H6J8E2_9PEZI|nr:hypothetical protein CMUS01_13943 [Colletotrichum musicola]
MDSIELRQRRGSLRSQNDTAFPRNSEHRRQHLQPVTYAQVPNDDEIVPDSPLLSSRMWNALSVNDYDQNSGRDWRVSVEDQPSSRSNDDPREEHAARPQPWEAGRATGRALVRKHIARGGWARYLNGLAVHMPALVMTAGILVLGSLHFYWYPEQGPVIKHKDGDYRLDPDIISNVLQLVAKLHELFIVASLGSIALAMFRRSLVTGGIHLGFLTGCYRVGDLAYLKTAAFWRQGFGWSNVWGVMLPGFLVFATLMSTAVGPASAILLVPSLGWYEIDASIAFGKINLPLFYTSNRTQTWLPVRKEAPKICNGVRGLYQGFCPAGGFEEIFNWLYDYRATDLKNNLTFHSTSADLRRHLVFTMANSTKSPNSATLCTTPPHFLTNSIGLFQRYIDSDDVGALSREPRYRLRTAKERSRESASHHDSALYQPFVQSKCTLFDKEEEAKDPSPAVYFPVDHLNCFNNPDCQRVQTKGIPLNKTKMAPGIVGVLSTSNFDLLRDSSVVMIRGQIPDRSSGKLRHFYYLCNLLASLVPSDFSVDPRLSDSLQSSASSPDKMQDLYRGHGADGVRVIKFTNEWFEALNPTWEDLGFDNMSAVGQLIGNFVSREGVNGSRPVSFVESNATGGSDYESAEIFLSKVFGAFLTDGLARMTQGHTTRLVLDKDADRSLSFVDLNDQYGRRGGVHKLTTINATSYRYVRRNRTTEHNGTVAQFLEPMERFLPIDIFAERYGYGSGQKRATLHWAQAVMGVYLAIVVAYALWVVVMSVLDAFGFESNHGQARVLSIIPWSDLQDLIILALRTPPPDDEDLADAGAGVSSSRVWEKTVWAGADEDSNAQLVLGKGQSVERLQVDRSAQYY